MRAQSDPFALLPRMFIGMLPGSPNTQLMFDRNQAVLDKDFVLFYSVGSKEIGVTPLMHKPISVALERQASDRSGMTAVRVQRFAGRHGR